MFGAIVWAGKNIGLILGIAEILVVAVVDILAQVAKAIFGIVNVLQPERRNDKLVALAEKIEKISVWISEWFKKVKGFLYNLGLK